MPKNLLIVESPAKAKTIEKYLGKDFKVKSSYGHIRDLVKGKDGVQVENNFELQYEISPEKLKVVKELKDLAAKSDDVWLATDEDREGEAISWHLCKVLGLDETTTKRIVFREITKPAIQKAIQEPRTVDINLVDAQQARRVLDRLVGFELSGLLWKKIKGGLSAGRVQSVAVKLIVEREREIQKFDVGAYYKVIAEFTVMGANNKPQILKADLNKKFKAKSEVEAFLKDCKEASYKIAKIDVRPAKKNPAAPFITSTLQQEASRKLGFSVSRTMSNAQRLYEAGMITYMRTDSTSLSVTATTAIEHHIVENFGKEYSNPRKFGKKSELAQEAHEAIRPTYIERFNVASDRDQQRLYELIWKRTVASQMASAKLEKTNVTIDISSSEHNFMAAGEVLVFDGFLKVYLESKDEEEDEDAKGILPPLKVGQALDNNQIIGRERFTKAAARFSEAALVKKMEELGIGRPSTYAPTITKITEPSRGYIVKESREGVEREYNVLTLAKGNVTDAMQVEITGAEKNKLFPTDLGMLVVDFLDEHFLQIMDYSFTASIEQKFDGIAQGEEQWKKILENFYSPFHAHVVETTETADRVTGERILGKDPESGFTLLVRMSKFGPVAQIGTTEELGEDVKPRYANLKVGQSLESIPYEQAIELFKFPREVGEYEDKLVIIGEGRFGPYIRFDEKYVSIPKDMDPLSISLEESVALIEQKRKEDAPIGTYNDKPFTRGKGRFGPFLKYDGMFVNIPKRFDPEAISTEEMHELIQAKIEKEANRYIHNWPEDKISVQNGRWGPFIKWGKVNVKLPKHDDGTRQTQEDALKLTQQDVMQLIENEYPDAFKKKKKKAAAKKKPATKKKAATKKKTK